MSPNFSKICQHCKFSKVTQKQCPLYRHRRDWLSSVCPCVWQDVSTPKVCVQNVCARTQARIVWCGMSFLPFLLPKLILLAFWLSWDSNKPKILGFNLSHPSTLFYVTIFKIAGSMLNMPHIDRSKLYTQSQTLCLNLWFWLWECPGIC